MKRNIWIEIFCMLTLSTYTSSTPMQTDKDSCMKPACIDAASEIQQNMDPSIQPCDDFYGFVCGGFFQKTIVPDHKRGFDAFNNLSDTINEQTRIMLEEATGDSGPKAFRLAKKLYDACTNTAAIERDGFKTINYYLDELGGWSLLKSKEPKKDEDELPWMELNTKLRKLGFGDYLVSLYLEADPRNKSQRILSVGYPNLIINKDWTEKEMADYRIYLTNVAVQLGADKEEAEKQLKESTHFEHHLAKLQNHDQERGMSIKELEYNYRGVPWLKFINAVVNDARDTVISDDIILVKSPHFLLNLIQILQVLSRGTLSNYLISRAVASMIPYTTDALRKEDLAFRQTLQSGTDYDPRWKECLHIVSGRLNVAVAAMYARKYFSDNKLDEATEIASNVKNEFTDLLPQLAWMDETTKQHAVNKINAMQTFIGYPKELLDNNKIDEYYSSLEADTNNYLQLIKKIDLFAIDNHFKEFTELVYDDSWVEQSHTNTISAYYNLRNNALQFPAGLLQEPFFNSERPRYMNYATLGSIMGHEIIHGFDHQGKHYDEHGELENWWSATSEANYAVATKCINQYYVKAGPPEVGLNINSLNSHEEIIADLAGLKQAYLAYQKWTQQNSAELLLPGLNYSHNQLFWISAANIWCAKYQSENGDFYSSSSFRVYEALRNLDQFSQDFDCPAGSQMNPEKKCTVF